jgi:hypothetical protein
MTDRSFQRKSHLFLFSPDLFASDPQAGAMFLEETTPIPSEANLVKKNGQ